LLGISRATVTMMKRVIRVMTGAFGAVVMTRIANFLLRAFDDHPARVFAPSIFWRVLFVEGLFSRHGAHLFVPSREEAAEAAGGWGLQRFEIAVIHNGEVGLQLKMVKKQLASGRSTRKTLCSNDLTKPMIGLRSTLHRSKVKGLSV
jgi:hypothetical protein